MKSVFKSYGQDDVKNFAAAIKQEAGDNPVYFCVGSDKVLIDSLGPKVGTRVRDRSNGSVVVYGVEGDTIMARNVQKAYRAVRYLHPSSKIIVIDAAIGPNIGEVKMVECVRPGSGVGKRLGTMGNRGILCTTGERLFYFCNDYEEINRRVNDAADFIANAILLASA